MPHRMMPGFLHGKLTLALRRAVWIAVVALLCTGIQPRSALEQSWLAGKQLKAIPAAEFARMIRDFSEAGGYFRSDNLVSNETAYLHVADKLKTPGDGRGAYIGVGPEQNFTYIAKIRPQIAFIVDIRRQAVIQHLMFKAIFHRAATRAQFLSLLFSKPVTGAGPGPDATAAELVAYFTRADTDPGAFDKNLRAIAAILSQDFHFPLDTRDRSMLDHVYTAFCRENLNVHYNVAGSGAGYRYRYGGFLNSWNYFPSFGDLILETDLHGKPGNFLASRTDYEFVRSLHESNRIIPIVGDFAGAKALASVADYLRRNGYKVAAFYTSNVEQYLFENRVFDDFARNVMLMPITEKSLFIRAYPNRRTPHPARIGNHGLTTLLQKMRVFLDDYRQGMFPDYWTLVHTHYLALLPD